MAIVVGVNMTTTGIMTGTVATMTATTTTTETTTTTTASRITSRGREAWMTSLPNNVELRRPDEESGWAAQLFS
jgi:hypothetical protein